MPMLSSRTRKNRRPDAPTSTGTGLPGNPRRKACRPSFDRLEARRLLAIQLSQNITADTVLNNAAGYVVVGNISVVSGVTVTVAPGIALAVNPGLTFTDNGTINVGTGATITLAKASFGTTTLAVNGAMTATSTTFNTSGNVSQSTTSIQVNAGGHLTANASTFSNSLVSLAAGSVLNAGDFANDAFNTTLSVPIADVPLLTNNKQFQDIDIVAGSLTSGQAIALNAIGTVTTANLRYVFPGAFTVQAGATLNVGTGVTVLIGSGQIFTDSGTLTFGTGDTLALVNANFGTTALVVNGTLTAATTTVTTAGNPDQSVTTIQVNPGGHFTASNSTVSISQLNLAAGSVLNAGDFAGDSFNTTLSLPIADVPLLANNKQFQDIDIIAGSLTSGQTIGLNSIGTVTTANLRYVFPGAFTIQAGATLNVAANVTVLIGAGQTFTDSGTLTFGTGDTLALVNANFGTTALVVNGTLTAATTTVTTAGNPDQSVTTIQVNPGGHFTASNSTVSISQLNLAAGSVLNAGDLAGDSFNQTISVPIADVPLLANNKQFQDIDIIAGGLASGQSVALNAIGTATTVNLRYVFAGAFNIAPGATLSVAPNVIVLIGAGQTLTDSGTLTTSTGDTLALVNANFGTTALVVNGTLTAATTTVTTAGNPDQSVTTIQVNSGGHLTASNSTFSVTGLNLAAGSVLHAGDLTSNGFDLPISLPAADVPLLASNRRFKDVDIITGGLASGQGLDLAAIGTDTTVNLRYVFSGAFQIASGATLSVEPNVTVIVGAGVTLTDGGAITTTTGDTLALADANFGTTTLAINGSLTATGTAITTSGTPDQSVTTIQVNSGGLFSDSGGNIALTNLVVNSGASASIHFVVFATKLSINSGATIAIHSDDLSAAAATVVASGTTGTTIDLTGNYWGTTDPTQIGTKITDHLDTASLPTVLFSPFVTSPATSSAVAASTTFSATTGQSIPVSATVTSPSGVVNEGTETFTVLSGTTVIGTSITVNVTNGLATGTYVLPAGVGGGTYILQTVFNGTANFLGNVGSSQLIINAATTANASAPASTTFNGNAGQSVPLTATVTSAVGTVNEGTETFTILSGTTVIGTSITVNVVNGVASGNYSLPVGVTGGTYIIQAVYNGTNNFLAITDTTHILTIAAASTSASPSPASSTFTVAGQTVVLSTTVTSAAGTVNEGTETFTILGGATVIGAAITVNVVNGAAGANYALPAGTGAGVYTIKAVYNGTSSFLAITDTTQVLTIAAASTTTSAAAASTTFKVASRTVSFSATVGSAAGTVNQGTETFTILSGSTVIGTAITVNVVNGAASGNYTLPAGLAPGTYTIKAVYNGTNNFLSITDTTQVLIISAATTATASAAASSTFTVAGQTVALSATVTSAAGTINEGTETFTILSGATVIGAAITINVINGAAGGSYTLPAGLAPGTYTIQAVYNGTTDFLSITDTTHHLIINAAATAVSAAAASATFNLSSQSVALSATVTSAAGTVNEGTETFTILSGATVIGTAITVNVVNGAAGANYALPAGTGAGTYTIQAVYNGTVDFLGITDTSHTLIIGAASTSEMASSASTTFHVASQTVSLSASITSGAGVVDAGTETFTILSGSTVIGTAITVNVVNGAAGANYALPAGTGAGTYTIKAVYSGTTNFLGVTDTSQSLTIAAATTTSAASAASTTFSVLAGTVGLVAAVTSGAGVVNEGTETFTVFNGQATVGSSVTVNVVNGSANAAYPLPAGTAAGTYTIRAVYDGTTNLLGSTDSTQVVTVGAAGTATSAAVASASYSAVAQSIAVSSTVTSAAGTVGEGTETFTILNGTTAVGTAVTVNVAAGAADATYTLPAGTAPGTYTIHAVYNGTADLIGSTDATRHLTVAKDATTIVVTPATATPVRGQTLTIRAVVATSPAGSGTPTGTVTFNNGTATLGTAPLMNVNGQMVATFTTAPLVLGTTSTITASYGGDATDLPSTSSTTFTAGEDATTTIAGPSDFAPVRGETLKINAIVGVASPGAGTPTGTVTFKFGSITLATEPLVSSGGLVFAQLPTAPMGMGTYTFTTIYNGDSGDLTSTGTTTFTVGPDATTTVAVPSTATSVRGQPVTLTAAVLVNAPGTGTAAGTVTFKDGTTTIGTGRLTTINGVPFATFTTSALAVGFHSITASYGGDPGDKSSGSTSFGVTVGKDATKTIGVPSATSVATGQPVVLYGVVSVTGPGSGTPSGFVVFKEGATTLGSGFLGTVNGLTYTFLITSTLSPGVHSITAVYQGDASDLPSMAAAFTVTVAAAGSSASFGLAAAPESRSVTTAPTAAPVAAPMLFAAPPSSGPAAVASNREDAWLAALDAVADERRRL